MAPPNKTLQEAAQIIAQELADQGLIIAAGWQMHRAIALLDVTNPREIDRYQEAFQAGAAHVFAGMMNMLDPGLDETEQDLSRMDKLHAECKRIDDKLRAKYGEPWKQRGATEH